MLERRFFFFNDFSFICVAVPLSVILDYFVFRRYLILFYIQKKTVLYWEQSERFRGYVPCTADSVKCRANISLLLSFIRLPDVSSSFSAGYTVKFRY